VPGDPLADPREPPLGIKALPVQSQDIVQPGKSGPQLLLEIILRKRS
jgi:hypothetical protein